MSWNCTHAFCYIAEFILDKSNLNKAFLRKLRSYLKKQELSESKSDFKFIAVAEPQGENHDNSWHIHLLLIFNSKAPYISNQDISDLWGYGITDTHKVYDADTLMCSNMMTDHFIIQTIPPAHLRSL